MIVKEIPIDKIFIAQYFIDEENPAVVEELMINIKEDGLINAIDVAPQGSGYRLVTGYHRLVACRRIGWKTIPADIVEKEFKSEEEEYIYYRNYTLNENRVRKHLNVYQLKKILDEQKELYYLQNPGARENEEKVLKEYNNAVKKEREINSILQDCNKGDVKYWNNELDKAKKVIEKTRPPMERLGRMTNLNPNKIRNLNILTDFETKVPGITKLLDQANIAGGRVVKISKFLNDNDIINSFRKLNTKAELRDLILLLEAKLDGTKINKSEIVDEGDGIYRIGTKHYISYTDKDFKIRKFDFNTKVNVNSLDVAKATLQMLTIEHLRVLVLCETDAIHDFITKSIGISK